MILGFYELTELPLSKERGNGPTLTEEEISIELCFPGFLNSCIKEPALSSPKISTPTPPLWEVHNIPSQNTHSGGVGRHTPWHTLPCWMGALTAPRGDGRDGRCGPWPPGTASWWP